MVAVVAKMNEFALNKHPFFTPSIVICWMESESMRPFCLISSILNQGIVPPSQYSDLFFEGVYPFLISNTSVIGIQTTLFLSGGGKFVKTQQLVTIELILPLAAVQLRLQLRLQLSEMVKDANYLILDFYGR